MDVTEQFFFTFTEANGVPGYEQEVRAMLRRYMEPLGELSQDKLGSLICHQPGDGPNVMLAGHMVGGSTDGSAIHLHGTRVPTVVVGIAARHIHSHGSIIHRDDYDNAVKWMKAVVTKLDAETVAGLTA